MPEVFVEKISDFVDGDRRIVFHDGIEIGVFHWQGRFYAYQNLCLHQGGPCCEGVIMHKVEDVLAPDKTWLGQKFSADIEARQGINRYFWPLRFDAPAGAPGPQRPIPANPAAPGEEGGPGGGFGFRQPPQAGRGTYRVKLTVDGKTWETTVTVREDPALNLPS